MDPILTHSPTERLVVKRTRRDPKPHFKVDCSAQLDAIKGCPALQVPEEHQARSVLQLVKQLDLSQVEKKYSSLGRHGYSPQSLLAVWVYASWIGIHEATKVARLLKTDAAFALLSGGYAISDRTLRRFRQQSGALFAEALEQTVRIAMERGLLEHKDLAIDSLRIRAHASMTEVRTLERSEKRLAELAKEVPTNEAEQARHDAKVSKHEKAIRQCQQRGRTNVVLTNELAGLMKFPNGTSQPGHRVTTTTSGSRNRMW